MSDKMEASRKVVKLCEILIDYAKRQQSSPDTPCRERCAALTDAISEHPQTESFLFMDYNNLALVYDTLKAQCLDKGLLEQVGALLQKYSDYLDQHFGVSHSLSRLIRNLERGLARGGIAREAVDEQAEVIESHEATTAESAKENVIAQALGAVAKQAKSS